MRLRSAFKLAHLFFVGCCPLYRSVLMGRSNSEPSQPGVTQESPSPNKTNAIAGPSRTSARPVSPMSFSYKWHNHTDTSQANPPAETSPELQPFAHFLEPYLNPPPGKKAKPIPEWIFEVSPEARRELDSIQIFGLDIHATDMVEGRAELRYTAEASASVLATPSGSAREGANPAELSPPSVPGPSSRAGIHSPISDPTPKDQPSEQGGEDISAASVSFPRPGQDTPLIYPQTQGAVPRASPSEQNELIEQSESEDDMHIRSFAPTNRNRRAGFDPLGFSSPAQMSSPAGAAGIFDPSLGYGDEVAARHQYEDMEESREQEQSERDEEEEEDEERDGQETDEEELSSYEREQRRLGMDMARGVTAADSSPISQWGRAHRPSPRKDDVGRAVVKPVASQQSESLSASQQSHDLSLSRFNKLPAQRADTGAGALDEISTQGDPRGLDLVAEQELMGMGGSPVQMGADVIRDDTRREVGSPRTTKKRRRSEVYTITPWAKKKSSHSADKSSPAKRRRPEILSQNNGASDESTPVDIQVATQSTPSGRSTFGLGQGLSSVIQRIISAGRATSVPVEPADRSGSPVQRYPGQESSVGVGQRGDRAGSVFAMLKPWGRRDDPSRMEEEEGVIGLAQAGGAWVPEDRTRMYDGVDGVVEEEGDGAEVEEDGEQVEEEQRAQGEGEEEAMEMGAEQGEDDKLQDQPHPRGSQLESDENAAAAGEESTLSAAGTRHELIENQEGTAAEHSRSRFDIDVREDKHALEFRDTATPPRAPKLEPQSQPKLGQLKHLAHPHFAESRPDRSVLPAHHRPSHDGPIKPSPHSPRHGIKSSPRSSIHLQHQLRPRDYPYPGSSIGIKVDSQSPQREQREQPQGVRPIQLQPLMSVSARDQAQMQSHTLEKLGGWKPDLRVQSGLTGEWIKERTDLVRAKRGRARAESVGRKSLGTGTAA